MSSVKEVSESYLKSSKILRVFELVDYSIVRRNRFCIDWLATLLRRLRDELIVIKSTRDALLLR